MSKDFLLEIGLEEMPAKYISDSAKQLEKRATEWFEEKKIEHGEVISFQSPRRLAVLVKEVSEKQADRIEEAKGPAKKIAFDEDGNWSKAAQGFARGHGVSPEEFTFREIKGVEYIYLEKQVTGIETETLLPEIKKIITDMTFPVSMHWGANEMRYIRPIKWLVALFGQEIVPFEVAQVKTGNVSRGHRFLGHETMIPEPKEYEMKLLEEFVVVDACKRKDAIWGQIEEVCVDKGWSVPKDEDLLEEVNNLVEYPTVLEGEFEESFLDLPEEILITSMKEHQRYFPVFNKEGELLPHFITVRNGNHEHAETVVRGNEKVLRARLSDGEFFYKEDLKMKIDDAVVKLSHIVFHEKLGTLSEKMKRVEQVALLLADFLSWSDSDKKDVARAAEIYKFDLVTNVVGEFPELQGIMGEKYARIQGEKPEVAAAIREHYMPISAEGALPETDLGSLLAVSDKLETLVSFFCVGMIPTGSQDPFSLRRSAFGVMRILLNTGWNLPLAELLKEIVTIERNAGIATLSDDEIYAEVQTFLKNRLRVILQDQKVRLDIIDSVTSEDANFVPNILERAKLLNESAQKDWFRPTIEALSRVANIAKKHEEDVEINDQLFENEAEKRLFDELLSMKRDFAGLTSEERLERFREMRGAIDQYFDTTLVMSEDKERRNNRLELLFELAEFIKEFAEMDAIHVK
ncbi:glycine--tRNA ligase subunit beta [Listeria kieliensis]